MGSPCLGNEISWQSKGMAMAWQWDDQRMAMAWQWNGKDIEPIHESSSLVLAETGVHESLTCSSPIWWNIHYSAAMLLRIFVLSILRWLWNAKQLFIRLRLTVDAAWVEPGYEMLQTYLTNVTITIYFSHLRGRALHVVTVLRVRLSLVDVIKRSPSCTPSHVKALWLPVCLKIITCDSRQPICI